MSKIIVVADIHINDYSQKNPTEKYRLYQSRAVCQNILEVAAREGADRIVIAGDTIEKYLIRPYIQAEVKDFLWNLMKGFKEGYIIWGNHDQDNKGNNSTFSDSCLSVMLPPNLHYADKKEITLDGTRMGFLNWTPDLDLSWVNGKLDILFTHATICYDDNERYQSQVLDETKFDIAFCGDIHRAAKKGKYVSIGVPQKAKMGDSDEATGVILDTSTKKWDWVNLNPNNNLMKLEYTEDKDKEGWSGSEGIWRTYKPANQTLQGNTKIINIPAWDNIAKLIDGSIKSNSLSHVHSEVLKSVGNLDDLEVDFSFIIKRLSAKNWRSIEDMEVFFGQYDKVKIVGPNGSGKSSILTALKYAFIKNSDYKSLTQFGAKDCRVEVDFEYQGNNYTIIRGTGSKNYGLVVNGTPQKYNSKSGFEDDLNNRFPFIQYIQDVMFLDSDHPRFIGSITPERKSEIISRFYKMDVLDAYNNQARKLAEDVLRQDQEISKNLGENEKLRNYIQEKLSQITLPTLSEDQLNIKKTEGLAIQSQWEAYNNFIRTQSALVGAEQASINKIEELSQKILIQRNIEDIQNDIRTEQDKLQNITQLTSNLQSIISDGKTAKRNRDELNTVTSCKVCGSEISKDKLDLQKAQLDNKLGELRQAIQQIYTTLKVDFNITDLNEINSGCLNTKMNINSSISNWMIELRDAQNLPNEKVREEQNLQRLRNQMSSLGDIPQKIELPVRFLEQMSEIEADLTTWKTYNSLKVDEVNKESERVTLRNSQSNIKKAVEDLKNYITLTGTCGKIYEEIMNSLAGEFSDNKVVYEVERHKGRGSRFERLNLTSYFVLGDNKVAYQNCSDGQKTYLDIDFMSKVLTKVGFLVFDEALKYLDTAKLDEVLEVISQMDVGLVLLSSHVESLSKFNNKTMSLQLNESGVTQVQLN